METVPLGSRRREDAPGCSPTSSAQDFDLPGKPFGQPVAFDLEMVGGLAGLMRRGTSRWPARGFPLTSEPTQDAAVPA